MNTRVESVVSAPEEQLHAIFDNLSPDELPGDGLQLGARNGISLQAGPNHRAIVVDAKEDPDLLGDTVGLRLSGPKGPRINVTENGQSIALEPFAAIALASIVTDRVVETFAQENTIRVVSTFPVSGSSNNVIK